jgi:hypothetical protein
MEPSKRMSVWSKKEPSVVMSCIIAPIIVLSVYVTIRSGIISNFSSTALLIVILSLILYYYNSLELILMSDRVVYKAMWRTKEIPIGNIQTVEPGRGPFGVGATWTIHSKDHAAPIVVNVATFDAHALHAFAEELRAKDSGIRFLTLKPRVPQRI